MALTVEDLYRQYAGREADPGGLEFWRAGFGSEISPQEVASFQQAVSEARAQGTEPAPVAQAAAAKPSLVDQILASSDTSKWSGEGKGSARANAEDMANILSGIGITDVSQFGQIEVPVDVAVRPVYEYIPEGYGDSASYTARIAGYTDQNGNPVDPSLVKPSMTWSGSGDGGGYEAIYTAPIGTQTAYGNKVTGQVVPNTYGERQTGDAFGGTYAGKGNTGYRAQFTPDGKPVFYTSAQSSSSLPELIPILTIGALALGLGGGLEGLFGAGAGTAGAAGLTAEQLALVNALGGAEVAGGLTAAGASAAGLGGGFGALTGLTAAQLAALEGLGGAEVAGGLTAAEASAAGLGGGFTGTAGLLSGAGMTAEQAAAMEGLGGADVAGGLTSSEAAAAGLGGGFTGVAGLTAEQLAAVNALGGAEVAGGLTAAEAGAAGLGGGFTGAATGALSGLTTSQIANLIKAGVGLVGAGGAASLAGGGGSNVSFQAPTQQVPTNSPEYYNQLQQYYNAYLPQTPRDVVTPLQQWYNSSYGA